MSGLETELTSIGFARLARGLGLAAAGFDIAGLAFRSPGRSGVGRAIRRNVDGSATIAVRYRGRPAVSVAADMIEGIVRAAPSTIEAGQRDALWQTAGAIMLGFSATDAGSPSSRPDSPPSVVGRRSQSSAARRRDTGLASGPPEVQESTATRRAA